MLLGCLTSPADYADLEARAQDADGDGQASVDYGGQDCDDQASEVYAGAPEQCDGLDNDCDQEIDEDIEGLPTFFPDADNDGFGDSSAGVEACEAPEGFVADSGDCDDQRPEVRPGQAEVCGNGLNDDCSSDAGECWEEAVLQISSLELVFILQEPGSVAFWPDKESLLVLDAGVPVELGVTDLALRTEGSKDSDVSSEQGVRADQSVAYMSGDGICLVPYLGADRFEYCGLEDSSFGEFPTLVVGAVFCSGGAGEAFSCVWEIERPAQTLAVALDAAGRGRWTGNSIQLAIAEERAVSVYTESQILSEDSPSSTLTLPGTPTSLCLLNQAVVWADASGTHLTSVAGETDLLTETTGTVSCMEEGSEYVLIIPPSNDRVEVVNLSGFGDPAWGAPLVVTLPGADVLLANKATLAAEAGQAYLFIAHGTELRRMELGLGL